jgi:hypothetical protein
LRIVGRKLEARTVNKRSSVFQLGEGWISGGCSLF